MVNTEKIKGELKQYNERTAKNGKKYITLLVGDKNDDIFAFWWGDKDNLKVTKDNEGDEVELIYRPGNFVGAVSCKVIKSGGPIEVDESEISGFAANNPHADAIIEEFGEEQYEAAKKRRVILENRDGTVVILK